MFFFSLKKAYKLLSHRKQAYQTKTRKEWNFKLQNCIYKIGDYTEYTSCLQKLSWVKQKIHSFF